MTKKQKNKIYKQLLDKLSKFEFNNTFRVCCQINNFTSDVICFDREINEQLPEWYLFKQDSWEFYNSENPDELRIFALQLCIEMTK